METFIYYCENSDGIKMSFFSKALLEPGLTVFDDNHNPFTIIDLDLYKPISVYEDAIEHTIERLMR